VTPLPPHAPAALAALTTPDTIVLVVCGLLALRGGVKGFAWQSVRLLALAAGIAGAARWHGPVGAWLEATLPVPEAMAPWVGWIAVLVGIVALGGWLAHLARGWIRTRELSGPDRLLGLALGAVVGLVLCTAGFLAYGRFAGEASLREAFEGSLSRRWIAAVIGVVEPLVPASVRDDWRPLLGTLEAGRAGAAEPLPAVRSPA
jgi:uncharacterized membrane protein required for colicin V production